MDRYVIGIDTGGTFTDGVLLDYRSREVVASAKTLTTRHDLREGVINVIGQLDLPEARKVKLVGISTTLATNSIAENKARRAALMLIGYDRDLITGYGLESGLGTETVGYFSGGHDSQGKEKAPLDLDGMAAWLDSVKDEVDAVAVSGFFSPLNADHENRAFAMMRERFDLPVVLAHQLSTKLDSVKRAATAALNASLVAVMQEFLEAVHFSLREHGIKAPLMIMRGDGTLMPYAEAVQKPVETVASGPAASASGGRFLTRHKSALVIDMGSTTTDISLVEDGQVVVSESGARVGETQTAVEAARICTLCVGCDSKIQINRQGEVFVGPERVVPLSHLGSQYPEIAQEIIGIKNHNPQTWKISQLEYWILYKPVEEVDWEPLCETARKAVTMLSEGPRPLELLMRECGVYHASQLGTDSLFALGYLGSSTLTPSDLLHCTGQMDLWNEDVARQAVRVICRIHGKDRRDFIENTLEKIVREIVEEVIVFLACQEVPYEQMPNRIDGRWGRWLFHEMMSGENPYLSVNIDSRFPLIGTGAPAKFFIRHVAEALSAPFAAPKYYEVANAVGAVAGSVMETREARVFEKELDGTHSYIVQIQEDHTAFDDLDEAKEYAENECVTRARQAAVEAGATEPHIEVRSRQEGALLRVVARAGGNPKLSEETV